MDRIYKNIFSQRLLLIGDTVVIALITLAGFATHGEIDRVMRMLTTFIPLFAAWFFVAPFYGLFLDDYTQQAGELWRVFWAMLAVIPLAIWLRGLWLNTPILPIFVLVMLGVSAPSMLIWRVVYFLLMRRSGQSYG